jgi:thioredoxin 1
MHHMKRRLRLLLLLSVALSVSVSAQSKKIAKDSVTATAAPSITFVELGSVNCVPCRMMQPVMKNIESKYGPQVKVIFYDVWKEDQKKHAAEYGIRLIPTQVFLDRNGKEVFRHEGFFPEALIDSLLAKHGLKANL